MSRSLQGKSNAVSIDDRKCHVARRRAIADGRDIDPSSEMAALRLLIATAAVVAAIWIIAAAIDAEAAKPKESLDVLLGYAIDFWMVVIGALLIAVSVALKAWFLLWKAKRSS